jgi:hypothetical protein
MRPPASRWPGCDALSTVGACCFDWVAAAPSASASHRFPLLLSCPTLIPLRSQVHETPKRPCFLVINRVVVVKDFCLMAPPPPAGVKFFYFINDVHWRWLGRRSELCWTSSSLSSPTFSVLYTCRGSGVSCTLLVFCLLHTFYQTFPLSIHSVLGEVTQH